jgi:hypothetical protein
MISVTEEDHNILVWNISGGPLVIDPAETETIDGATNVILQKDEWRCIRRCESQWTSMTLGRRTAMDRGKICQLIHKKLDLFASGTANHLRDDTKPHVSDMDAVPGFSHTITPSGPNDIHVHVTLQVSNSAPGWVLGGLFVNDDEWASAVAEGYVTAGTDDQTLAFWFKTTAADSRPMTFKIYMATSNGAWFLNGSTGRRRLFGGAWYSSMEIIEIER